jgi:hypothetical protein
MRCGNGRFQVAGRMTYRPPDLPASAILEPVLGGGRNSSGRQVLLHTGFENITVFDLNLYVFYMNPFNYVAMALAAAGGLSLLFRACFLLHGKKHRLFGKKIAAPCLRPEHWR